MWTIKEVKERGRETFKNNYWRCVIVALILSLLAGGGASFSAAGPGGFSGFNASNLQDSDDPANIPDNHSPGGRDFDPDNYEDFDEGFEFDGESDFDFDYDYGPEFDYDFDYDFDDDFNEDPEFDFDRDDSDDGVYFNYEADGLDDLADIGDKISRDIGGSIPAAAIAVGVAVFVIVFLIVFALAMALSVFIINPLLVGGTRFFVKNLDEKASVSNLGYAFDNNYKNIALTMFLKDLYTFLWSLLFIIPGIIKSYEYRMIPYLLADDPTMTHEQAFAISKQMMTGNKWKAFVLDLSFIGWYILSVFTLGILAVFYVEPYVYATRAALYRRLLMGSDNGYTTYPGAPVGGYDPYSGAPTGSYDPYNSAPSQTPAGNYDPNTGAPINAPAGNYDPNTGAPINAPAGNYDPNTGTPINAPAGNYDPNTGAPINAPAGNYDPNIGAPINAPAGNYDPNTGAPVNAPAEGFDQNNNQD